MADLVLVVGTARVLTARETGAGAKAPGPFAPTWTTSDAAVAALVIDVGGLPILSDPYVAGTKQDSVGVRGIAPGLALITATDGALSGTFTVQVVTPDTITIKAVR